MIRFPLLQSFGGRFLHLDLRRLFGVKDELLKVSPVDRLLELLPDGLIADSAMSHIVMECTVIARFGALRIR